MDVVRFTLVVLYTIGPNSDRTPKDHLQNMVSGIAFVLRLGTRGSRVCMRYLRPQSHAVPEDLNVVFVGYAGNHNRPKEELYWSL